MALIKVRNQESGAENGLWMERGTRGRREGWSRRYANAVTLC